MTARVLLRNPYVGASGAPTFPSGAALLDAALGGGWARARVINLVGDRSTGKTLLAIEACANFARAVPGGRVLYVECEHAFDRPYAESIGFPASALLIDTIATVEQLFIQLQEWSKDPNGAPTLVVVDSLDALSDESENQNALGDQGYGAKKPKLLSEMFRRLNAQLATRDVSMLFISQVRENIGVSFGAKYTRSGGKALDFYCSQIVWLSEVEKIKKTVRGVTRSIGAIVRARVTKNKISAPFREIDVRVLYHYGMDDVHTSLYWLKTAAPEALEELQLPRGAVSQDLDRLKNPALQTQVRALATAAWARVEEGFAQTARKYP